MYIQYTCGLVPLLSSGLSSGHCAPASPTSNFFECEDDPAIISNIVLNLVNLFLN
jgi:hypothetical protein